MKRLSASVGGGAAALLALQCFMYDPIGPSLPRIAGAYVTTVVVEYSNARDTRADTLRAVITLPNVDDRGGFLGRYRIGTEVGLFGGVLFPSGRIEVPTFGPAPQPIARVMAVQLLYPQCDFTRVGTGQMLGELRGDSLHVTGIAFVPCRGIQDPSVFDLTTTLTLLFTGLRPK
jgi:hypothetical protein